MQPWERRMLRAIYGGVNTENGWQRKTNEKIETTYKERKITTFIKAQRIRWLGDIERMEKNRMTKMVLNRKPTGKKRKGKPHKRWMDGVKDDLQMLNSITEWKDKTTERRKWKRIAKEASEKL
ncbi:hypothetical protein ILUMI_16442 [Ignelater luminosus]|uniref:Endonuclease-reverse transcriptase n=1 Tax=Ignelater luminosus TaxID=2038154 RepID=A0A8K0CQB7_IGNLU|nr:hypothetical protein ILUMI_16442 [Ignelater luminosus]